MIDVRLRKRLGDFAIDAAFESGAGVTALFGASGAGKTTIVNAIAGLIAPDEGRIAVGGATLFDSESRIDLPPERRGIGYVFQEDRLFPHMTVRRNLAYGTGRTESAGTLPAFEEIVSLLDIGPLLDRAPHRLSGGEKQRVAIGRALLSGPRLLLMDEPLANLDGPRRQEILPFLERLRADLALPIVYVSHAIDEVSRLADTLVVLDKGRVAAAGPITQVTAQLDIGALTDRTDVGTVLDGRIAGHDRRHRLTTVAFGGGELVVPEIDGAPGASLRLRIQARDVAIATSQPVGLSVLNRFAGVIEKIAPSRHAHRDVRIDIGVPIIARITGRSVEELNLSVGTPVTALVKSVAVEQVSERGD